MKRCVLRDTMLNSNNKLSKMHIAQITDISNKVNNNSSPLLLERLFVSEDLMN